MSSIVPTTYIKTKPTPQNPIAFGFGAETTAAEVIRGIDLSGKTAIVTGGYSDIGLETTRTLLSAGWSLLVTKNGVLSVRIFSNISGLGNSEAIVNRTWRNVAFPREKPRGTPNAVISTRGAEQQNSSSSMQ